MATTAKRSSSVSNRQGKRNARKSSSIVSLENGIKIMKYAIRHKVSLSAASNVDGRGKNYISDIKARLELNYMSRNISRELYNEFKALSKQYEKVVR